MTLALWTDEQRAAVTGLCVVCMRPAEVVIPADRAGARALGEKFGYGEKFCGLHALKNLGSRPALVYAGLVREGA